MRVKVFTTDQSNSWGVVESRGSVFAWSFRTKDLSQNPAEITDYASGTAKTTDEAFAELYREMRMRELAPRLGVKAVITESFERIHRQEDV